MQPLIKHISLLHVTYKFITSNSSLLLLIVEKKTSGTAAASQTGENMKTASNNPGTTSGLWANWFTQLTEMDK